VNEPRRINWCGIAGPKPEIQWPLTRGSTAFGTQPLCQWYSSFGPSPLFVRNLQFD
jgi:hypothetical protein